MSEEMTRQMTAAAERLGAAAEMLDRVLQRLDAQQEALNAKVDRIVAAVEASEAEIKAAREAETKAREEAGKERAGDLEARGGLRERVEELEKANADLKAQAARLARKTLPPVVSALLGKNADGSDRFDADAVEKSLQSLSVEQRIAVKAELARAGMIE